MSSFDFHKDLKKEIVDILNEAGIKISLNQNIQKILIDFFNLRSKILDVKKRKVFVVPSFKEQIKGHYKEKEIQTIIEYARDGENLNAFQSHRIIQSKQIDHLSNEWNIFHFHLSLEADKKPKFVKRGDLLLFAYIEADYIVFLGLAKHKDSFSDIKWLETLQSNFPQLLEKYLPPDLPEIAHNFSNSERKEAWESGVSEGFIKLNGKTYLNPGFGKITSGHNIQVVMQSNHILNWITQIVDIIQKSKDDRISRNDCLKLRFGHKSLEIYDSTKENVLFEFPNLLMNS